MDWSAGALGSVSYAGTPVQLDIAYGTDEIFNGKGFWFDKVTLTDIEILEPDAPTKRCPALDSQCFVIKVS